MRLQAEIDASKATALKVQMEHQSALDQMEVRIHEEARASTEGVMSQLETELRAVSAARDAVLARRESDAASMKGERERAAKQVEQLQTLLEESRAAAVEQGRKNTEVQSAATGHQQRVDDAVAEVERMKNELAEGKRRLETEEKSHQVELKRVEERRELDRMRWKRDMDGKDKRIKLLERACRDRDAEKVQRVANTVCFMFQLLLLTCLIFACEYF